ncbi:DUF899 family protein [Luteipulveratus sp. YIM 133132]|uniref:DUF899 family protein n=1 Tax=Luteipulveratus flavus TaxID=3031728 RepID=UPI0023B028EB|nr:DUF899 family protein [Luteipulveratus sp. YIM 133132]MDE9364903.1 DUF899 family protein [Luteipulveratus sp. YIM 133132]
MASRTPAPALPTVVSEQEWQSARAELLTAEKDLTHALDALAARRRRMPMVRVEQEYTFASPDGPVTLLELFGEKHQLALYQFMNLGPDRFCPGCTNFTDQVVALDTLAENGVAWRTVSDMPLEQMTAYWQERGWTVPYASSHGTTFAADCGAGEGFLLSAFLRDGDDVYRTYSTTQRGVDRVMFEANVLDLLPYGRQERWEDSPAGWPQA